jgi:hypothetical protein
MLTAIEAPLYDVRVLGDRGMLPGLDGIPAAAVLDRLALLKYRNAHGSHKEAPPESSWVFAVSVAYNPHLQVSQAKPLH